MLRKTYKFLMDQMRKPIRILKVNIYAIGILGVLLVWTNTMPVFASEGLPIDETQEEQAEAFGLSTEQPSRTSLSGEIVDKTQSPLGVSNITYYGVNQLVEVGDDVSLKRRLDSTFVGMTRIYSTDMLDAFWSQALKSVTSADTNGDGKDEVVLAGLYGSNPSELRIKVLDYSGIDVGDTTGKPVSKEYIIDDIDFSTLGASKTEKLLEAVSGDFNKDGIDEIAVMVNSNLYILKADMDACTTVASTIFDRTNPLVINRDIDLGKYVDIMAADTDRDGFSELQVMLTGSTKTQLLIFDDMVLTSLSANITLDYDANEATFWITNPSMDYGDILGEGEDSIVVSGREFATLKPVVTTVHYNAYTDSYDNRLTNTRFILDYSEFTAVKGSLGVQCVDFEVLKPGDPEYVVVGGFIYRYNAVTGELEKQVVTSVSSNTNGNDVETSLGSITNVNVKKDKTYILDMVSGGFDEAVLSDMSLSGKEELYMLNMNEWYGNTYLYRTRVYMDDDGDLIASMTNLWDKDKPYVYNTLTTADIFNRGLQLSFEPEKSVFAFSNPTVIAVLGATPYYSELEDEYAGLGNVGTVYGTDSTSEASKSNGVTANIGLSFGYTQGVGVFGIKLAEFSFETEVTNSFAYTWSNGNAISKTISYTNYYNDDAVVAMVIPYDIYYFKVYNTETGVESEMAVNVPYSPISKIMPLSEYNDVAKQIDNAPIIGDEVLNHTIGNPRSYPSASTGLSNIEGEDVLLGGTSKNESENFMSTGVGSSHTEQSITTTSTSGKSFDYELDINVSFNSNILGVTSGISAGAGYTHNATITSSESTIRTGQVASLPLAYKQYEFQWLLAAYNYELEAGDEQQTCVVINYLTKPIGVYPAEQPENFEVSNRKLNGTELAWSASEGAAGYRIYRSDAEDGDFTLLKNIAGKSNVSYVDTTAEISENYYYNLVPYNSKDAIGNIIEAGSLAVLGMTVVEQPKLLYEEDENLVLSDMIIKMSYSDDTSEELEYDALKDKLTFSISEGTALKPTQTGVPITMTYSFNQKSVNTKNLTVNVRSPYDLTLTAKFKVGTETDAKLLAAGKTFGVNLNLKNNGTSGQNVFMIVAIYNEDGTMLDVETKSATVAGSGSSTISLENIFTLPSKIEGHYVVVMVWDGSSFATSKLIPKSNFIIFP
ncbi:MAG: hypothetical protein JXR88_04505 [Clostridia bacterium]|nr:hypothetical protein [Clostridia bacterium]